MTLSRNERACDFESGEDCASSRAIVRQAKDGESGMPGSAELAATWGANIAIVIANEDVDAGPSEALPPSTAASATASLINSFASGAAGAWRAGFRTPARQGEATKANGETGNNGEVFISTPLRAAGERSNCASSPKGATLLSSGNNGAGTAAACSAVAGAASVDVSVLGATAGAEPLASAPAGSADATACKSSVARALGGKGADAQGSWAAAA